MQRLQRALYRPKDTNEFRTFELRYDDAGPVSEKSAGLGRMNFAQNRHHLGVFELKGAASSGRYLVT